MGTAVTSVTVEVRLGFLLAISVVVVGGWRRRGFAVVRRRAKSAAIRSRFGKGTAVPGWRPGAYKGNGIPRLRRRPLRV